MKGCTDYSEEARRWREPGTGKARPVHLLIILAVVALLALTTWLLWPKPATEGFSLTPAGAHPSTTADTKQAAGTSGGQLSATEFISDAGTGQAASADATAAATDGGITVYLTGAVPNPGVYKLSGGARLNDAVLLAGGLTADAAANYINLASPLQDGAHTHIPTQDEVGSGEADRIVAGSLGTGPAQAAAAPTAGGELNQKVNINTADNKQLITLPGIGEALAKRIVDYRTKNGSFTSIDDLKNVSGIGEKKFEELADKICV